MSKLSNFLKENLINALQEELLNHTPEMQSFLLKELNSLALGIIKFVEEKIKGEHHEEGKK
jgi:hypothetical protein